MALTPAQLTTLKTDIDANFGGVPNTPDGDQQIAEAYNAKASPDYWVWRRRVSTDEMAMAINLQNMADITTADSDRVIKFFDIRPEGFFGELASERSAFDDVFSAAAGDESQQAIAALWPRTATLGEKVLATNTDTGASAANADTMDHEGVITAADVNAARALP